MSLGGRWESLQPLADEIQSYSSGTLDADQVECAIRNCVLPQQGLGGRNTKSLYFGEFGEPARSVHPRHILINWKQACVEATGSVFVESRASEPWMVPLVALLVFDRVREAMTVEIASRAAMVLWFLWRYRSRRTKLGELHEQLNAFIAEKGLGTMTWEELHTHLENLRRLGCIAAEDNTYFELAEHVVVPISW